MVCTGSQSVLKATECHSPIIHRLRSPRSNNPPVGTRAVKEPPEMSMCTPRPKQQLQPPSSAELSLDVYGEFSWHLLILARLRAGQIPLLKVNFYLLDPSADPPCPLWKEEPQIIEHWLQRCSRLDAERQNIFGSPSSPLKVLTTYSERVLALTKDDPPCAPPRRAHTSAEGKR